MTNQKTILVIGGTGHFGGRICRRLLGEPNTNLVVTSRSVSSAQNFVNELKQIAPNYKVTAGLLDQSSDSFERDLEKISPDIVVHTAGPYQGQSYRVAEACIAAKCHYIDLADGRDFVEGFGQLDSLAKNANVLAVSGASTLPGLSSAVTDHLGSEFQSISSINISIAPAHQTPRGFSTISAVLSYCGKPFKVLENGIQITRYGWQDLRWQQYPELGKRLSAACDVPDLSILPVYLPGVQTVTFHAALEARWEQLTLWSMGWLSRFGLITNWSKLVPLFNYISERLVRLGSDKGGMHIRLSGIGKDGAPKGVTWFLTAKNNHGPEIPCTPAIILARKLAQGEISMRGALPCLGLISLADWIFTTPAVVIQFLTGLWLTSKLGIPYGSIWFVSVLALFILVGICWLPVVFIQIRIKEIIRNGGALDDYRALMKIWIGLGIPAFASVLILIYLMVSKLGTDTIVFA